MTGGSSLPPPDPAPEPESVVPLVWPHPTAANRTVTAQPVDTRNLIPLSVVSGWSPVQSSYLMEAHAFW
jgi:hypothetical protein